MAYTSDVDQKIMIENLPASGWQFPFSAEVNPVTQTQVPSTQIWLGSVHWHSNMTEEKWNEEMRNSDIACSKQSDKHENKLLKEVFEKKFGFQKEFDPFGIRLGIMKSIPMSIM